MLAPVHERLVRALEARPGVRWLDVATGTGALALLAARGGADVSGVDLAPKLIETARRLAAEEGLAIRFEVGDAETSSRPGRELRCRLLGDGDHLRPRPPGGRRRARPRLRARRAPRLLRLAQGRRLHARHAPLLAARDIQLDEAERATLRMILDAAVAAARLTSELRSLQMVLRAERRTGEAGDD
jgi:SAM-dependent methyltransferase